MSPEKQGALLRLLRTWQGSVRFIGPHVVSIASEDRRWDTYYVVALLLERVQRTNTP